MKTNSQLSQEADELRAIGDGLQSAASRVADWIRKGGFGSDAVPYEVSMAALEAQDYIARWTDARAAHVVELSDSLSPHDALEALNDLRSNIVATQSASWSNTTYPLVAILNAAGYGYTEPSKEQRQQHFDCYGGAGGFPGRLQREPLNPTAFPMGTRERALESLLRRQLAGVKPPTEDEIREAIRD